MSIIIDAIKIWLTTSGGVIIADMINIIKIAIFLFFVKIFFLQVQILQKLKV